MEQQILSGKSVRALMRSNKKTIKGIAAQYNLTQKRVRQVRTNGVNNPVFVRDWLDILQS